MVGVLVKEDLHDNVIEVRRVNMLHKVENLIKKNFYDEDLSRELSTNHTSQLTIGMRNINGHVGRNIDGLQGVHG